MNRMLAAAAAAALTPTPSALNPTRMRVQAYQEIEAGGKTRRLRIKARHSMLKTTSSSYSDGRLGWLNAGGWVAAGAA